MPVDNAQLLGPERHIFLSPHYDDIALSCGGTAKLLADGGRQPEVALIFGDYPAPGEPFTSFAQQLHRQWGLSAEAVIDSRRAEEASASALIGSVDLFLPFRDAIYRGDRYTSDDDLFGEPRNDEYDLPSRIIGELGLGSQSRETIRLYAPLAIGGHVDHHHAFQTGVRLFSAGYSVRFYEDLPYALIPGKAEKRLDSMNPKVSIAGTVDVSSVWKTKIDAIMAYPSQLQVIFSEYVGAGSTREAIDAAMRRYSEQVGGGTASERYLAHIEVITAWRLRPLWTKS